MSVAEEWPELPGDTELVAGFPEAASFLEGGTKRDEILQVFWREHHDRLMTRYGTVQEQLGSLQLQYSVAASSDWQSFHVLIGGNGSKYVWIVGSKRDRTRRVVMSTEVHDGFRTDLNYAEWFVGGDANGTQVVDGTARIDDRREGWTAEKLGDCAVIEVLQDSRAIMTRGKHNWWPTAATPTGGPLSIERWDAAREAENALARLEGLLAPLMQGVYYEPLITGNYH